MASRGEHNIGHLCRKDIWRPRLFDRLRNIQRNGCGSLRLGRPDGDQDRAAGNSARATNRCATQTGLPSFLLGLRGRAISCVGHGLGKPRLERAIGVIYRPDTELASHYFQAVLPEQFDEYIWFDQTTAVAPFETKALEAMPDTYPFGL